MPPRGPPKKKEREASTRARLLSRLEKIFVDMGIDLLKEDIEQLILEYAVRDAEHDEVYFAEFVDMLKALPATHALAAKSRIEPTR